MRARIGADDGRRPDGGPLPMTLAWQFLAQRGYRPVRPGEAPTDAPTTWLWSAKIGSPCRARGSSPSVT
jgi:hypothetical protein